MGGSGPVRVIRATERVIPDAGQSPRMIMLRPVRATFSISPATPCTAKRVEVRKGAESVVFRVGSGQLLFNVEGPED